MELKDYFESTEGTGILATADADGNVEPEIVVVAIVEEGGHGSSVAAPVVRRVMEAYFGYEPGGSIQVPVTE